MTKMGTEKVSGQKATKYKIESTDKGEDAFSGFAWLNKQNIPVRFEGTASEKGIRQDIEIEYTNIVVARQDPQLFVVPADYRQMNAGMGAMGTSGKNLDAGTDGAGDEDAQAEAGCQLERNSW